MATRFIQEAESQLAPAFQTQIQGLESQIPQIGNLFDTLSTGLQQTSQRQIESGSKSIVEDAARRGVLRSTLPVDARQELQSTIGQALTEGLSQLGAQRAQQIGNVRSQVGQLGISRAQAIAELSRALETQDLARQQLEFEKQKFEKEFQADQAARAAALAAEAKSAAGVKYLLDKFNQPPATDTGGLLTMEDIQQWLAEQKPKTIPVGVANPGRISSVGVVQPNQRIGSVGVVNPGRVSGVTVAQPRGRVVVR